MLSSRATFSVVFVFGILAFAGNPSAAQSQQPGLREKAAILNYYGKVPLHFERNDGQADKQAKFLSRGNGYTFFLTSSEAVLVLRRNEALGRKPSPGQMAPRDSFGLRNEALWTETNNADNLTPQILLRSRVLGANPNATVSAEEQLPGKSNYFIGKDPKAWRTNIPSFAKVRYSGVYPGIDLVYYGNQAQLEYDFVLGPGASPSQISFAISGEERSTKSDAKASTPIKLRIDKSGDLLVACAAGQLRYQKPLAYQITADGHKELVEARFVLKSKNDVGFEVSSYDRSRTLTIDPVLLYSTYIAGATPGPYYYGYFGDQAAAIAVDPEGSAYITGTTASGDFPITSAAYQTACKPYGAGCSNNGAWAPGYGTAVFVSKLSPDGSSLVYSTYLAGSVTDSSAGIAVDSSGNAYIAGSTNSPDFPVTHGAYQTVCSPELDEQGGFCGASAIVSKCGAQGYPDGFVTKLDPSGSAIVYSTFLGGSLNDYLTGIAVDAAGEAYVSGFTLSSYTYGGLYYGCPANSATASYGYPITPDGYFPGPLPAPIAGQQWPFGSPSAFTLASVPTVSGFPFSDNHTPVFSKLSADGSTMIYSTYIGGGLGPIAPGGQGWGDGQTFEGPLSQNATGIAIDSSGDAYLTGYSNASDLCCTQYGGGYQFSGFPTTPDAVQPHNGTYCANSQGYCGYNAFVAKFDPAQAGAASLVYSTNLGSDANAYSSSIAVDSAGNAFVTGTVSINTPYNQSADFPTTQGTIQPTCPGNCGGTYGWLAKLNPTATMLDYSTYLPGSIPQYGSSINTSASSITLDTTGNAYVAGQTNAGDYPQINALQGGFPGGVTSSPFISVFDPTASTVLFSTFWGGSGNQYQNNGISGIALDSSENIYVTGSTTASAFPTTTGAFQTTCAKCSSGSWGAFVTAISAIQQVPTLQSITVFPSSQSVATGLTQQFTATGHYSDNSTQNLTASVTWSSPNTSVATISTQGLATGVASGGPITITAALNSINGTAQLTVTAATLQSITVSPTSASIASGLSQQFSATGHYSDNSTQDITATVTWSSSNTGVATISNLPGSQGLATSAATGGPITINAALGSISGTAQLTVTAAVLQSIAVTPSPTSVAAGLTTQFTATGHYSDNTTQNLTASVTWSSSITSVATINAQGLATGVTAGGPVTITASQNTINGTAQLTVTAAVLQSISVSPGSASVAAGFTQQFTATGHYSDNSTQTLTSAVTWSSAAPAIATISNTTGSQGLASGVAAGGPVNITAAQGAISGTAQLTVTAPVLLSIAIAPTNPSVPAGSVQQFTATGTYSAGAPQNITSSVTWSSSNTAVATINSSGLATAVAGGASTVSARLGNVSNSTTMTVITLQSITISPLNPSIFVGSKQQFSVTGHYSNGSVLDLTSRATWSSSKTSIATITSPGGLATGLSKGSSTIKAVLGDLSASTTLTVNAPTLTSITITPATATIAVGGQQQFKATANYSNGTLQDVTNQASWSASPKGVVSISTTGLATDLKAGTATITAKFGGLTGSATLMAR